MGRCTFFTAPTKKVDMGYLWYCKHPSTPCNQTFMERSMVNFFASEAHIWISLTLFEVRISSYATLPGWIRVCFHQLDGLILAQEWRAWCELSKLPDELLALDDHQLGFDEHAWRSNELRLPAIPQPRAETVLINNNFFGNSFNIPWSADGEPGPGTFL